MFLHVSAATHRAYVNEEVPNKCAGHDKSFVFPSGFFLETCGFYCNKWKVSRITIFIDSMSYS